MDFIEAAFVACSCLWMLGFAALAGEANTRAVRLYEVFCWKFPIEAQREIPYFNNPNYSHPGKLLFFFRKKSRALLVSDPEVWRLRSRLRNTLLLLAGWFLSLATSMAVAIALFAR